MRRFGTLLLLLVAALAGYTYWQVTRLQADVAELKAAVARRQYQKAAPAAEDARRLLAEATQGLRRARTALDRGQTRKARRELDGSLRKLAEVSKMVNRNVGNGELTEAWRELKSQMDRLWKQFAKESKRK
ncbi:MAG: hypothetical protein Q7T82_11745 [Armatimonadota bacterium]|nr:hypothetical protein [Armatimonadota bacterium]